MQVYDVIISWVSTICVTLAHHGLQSTFVCDLEAWLVHLRERCTDPQQRQELSNATASFSEAVVKLLMDTGDHALALERLGCEELLRRSQPLSAYQVSSVVRCMLALKQQPWDWIRTVMAVNGHSLRWAEILRACILDCQRLESYQQATVSLCPMSSEDRMVMPHG